MGVRGRVCGELGAAAVQGAAPRLRHALYLQAFQIRQSSSSSTISKQQGHCLGQQQREESGQCAGHRERMMSSEELAGVRRWLNFISSLIMQRQRGLADIHSADPGFSPH